ncbi:hypothetical protein DBR18_03780 [Pseudomonas sp. HMWF021]|nr:hypothetical protein DBR18_03780 [Pseudomonas sp. HMWF021]
MLGGRLAVRIDGRSFIYQYESRRRKVRASFELIAYASFLTTCDGFLITIDIATIFVRGVLLLFEVRSLKICLIVGGRKYWDSTTSTFVAIFIHLGKHPQVFSLNHLPRVSIAC